MRNEMVEREGERVLCLSTHGWEAEIAVSFGANLFRLKHLPSGLDLLRYPESMAALRENATTYGIPVLFPPNRIDGGVFTAGGRMYRFPVNEPARGNHLHGLLLGQVWTLDGIHDGGAETVVRLSFTSSETSDFWSYFPHRFVFHLTYSFADNRVFQATEIENLGAEPMPLGVGYHTSFRFPFGAQEEEAVRLCTARVAAGDTQWELEADRKLPTGRQIPYDPELDFSGGKEVLPAGKTLSLHCANDPFMREGRAFRGAVLESPADGMRVVYEPDDAFPYWMLWNAWGANAFYPEPMSWISNAPNSTLPPEVSGLRLLEPGRLWRGTVRLTAETM